MKVPKKELRKLKKKDKQANDLLGQDKDLKNITNILDEDMNEEVNEHIKSKNSRKLMNEQLKNYLGNKTIRSHGKHFNNDEDKDNYREKKFSKQMEEKKTWKKREFIRNKNKKN